VRRRAVERDASMAHRPGVRPLWWGVDCRGRPGRRARSGGPAAMGRASGWGPMSGRPARAMTCSRAAGPRPTKPCETRMRRPSPTPRTPLSRACGATSTGTAGCFRRRQARRTRPAVPGPADRQPQSMSGDRTDLLGHRAEDTRSAVQFCGWIRGSALRLADVDHPGDAEPVRAHAEHVTPHLLLQRHGHGGAGGQLLPVAAQLGVVVAAQAHREVVARGCAPCQEGCRRPSG
jgi:hypothetical protein